MHSLTIRQVVWQMRRVVVQGTFRQVVTGILQCLTSGTYRVQHTWRFSTLGHQTLRQMVRVQVCGAQSVGTPHFGWQPGLQGLHTGTCSVTVFHSPHSTSTHLVSVMGLQIV
jgi:hypothetical protein